MTTTAPAIQRRDHNAPARVGLLTGCSPSQIERRFYSRDVMRPLRQREIDYFLAAGVSALDLAFPDMLLAARISFEPRGTFLLADEMRDPSNAEPALVLLCRDDLGEAVDIAAWQPSTGRTGTWLKRAWTINESIFDEFRDSVERRIPVYRSPLEWLRDGRGGIVVLDAERARWWIAYLGMDVLVEDVPHGRSLRRQLVIPSPAIFVSPASANRVAA